MILPRRKFPANIVAPLLVGFLLSTVGMSHAFRTSSHTLASMSSKIESTSVVSSRDKNNPRPRTRSRIYLYGPSDFGMEMGGEQEPQRQKRPRPTIDRPTETSFDALGPKSIPAKPKIVVLGATGRIGRNVIRQLMGMKNLDIEIVAFVRNYDKAIRVLYDDRVVVSGGGGVLSHDDGSSNNRNKRGPKLQIVQGDLVPPEELPGFVMEDSEEEHQWEETAKSAANFYDNKVKDYDNRHELPDVNESLEDAIRDCTTIISCVGSVRRTNLWHDVLARPFVRLLKADVSTWCKDGRHPFYVNYASTRKALGYAEREQVRREASAITMAESEGLDLNDINVPRIRFIRISDVCVGYRPWGIVPLVANAVHSLTFRYQEMAEQLLEESSLIETVVLRPGDLVDEERDVNTTSIQVSSSGRVQSPALIGREDVATLAVAAATFVTQNKTNDSFSPNKGGSRSSEPLHYTFGCRWVGQTLDSYPPQGHKLDGHPDPAVAFRRSLKKLFNKERQEQRYEDVRISQLNRLSLSTDLVARMAKRVEKKRQNRRRLKPYGICVALPMYLTLAMFGNMIIYQLLQAVPGGKEVILPRLGHARNVLTLGLTSLLHRLPSLLPWIGKIRKPVYIPF